MAERRLALLIGQSASVPGFPDLKYCRQDVDKLAWALEKLCGFRVLILIDAEKADFRTLRKQFMQELSGEKGALALVYYAGHGVCSQGIAYWIPIDAEKDQLSTYQAVNDFFAALMQYDLPVFISQQGSSISFRLSGAWNTTSRDSRLLQGDCLVEAS